MNGIHGGIEFWRLKKVISVSALYLCVKIITVTKEGRERAGGKNGQTFPNLAITKCSLGNSEHNS